tara:strand:- start:146 stop:313 length:168 start_codon:yes stop_codon:yes gene_type:complete
LSDNRGVATRIKKGIFWESLPSIDLDFLNIMLNWEGFEAYLVIDENGCRVCSKKY